jgi:hypothetical protein
MVIQTRHHVTLYARRLFCLLSLQKPSSSSPLSKVPNIKQGNGAVLVYCPSSEESPAVFKQSPPYTITSLTYVFRGSVEAAGHLRQNTKLVYRLQTSLLVADVGVARPYN